MTRNMGTTDRAIRAFGVAPAAIVVAFLVGAGTAAGVILFAVAGIMLATSATGFCPNYVLIGISTDPHLHRVGLFGVGAVVGLRRDEADGTGADGTEDARALRADGRAVGPR